MTQKINLDAIAALAREAKARADRATPGPWKWWTSCSFRRLTQERRGAKEGGVMYAFRCSDGVSDIQISEADMAFTEASRTDVPALADAVLALVEMVRVLERNISEAAIDAAAEHVRVVAFLEHQAGLRVDDKSAWAALLGAAFAIKGREHDKCLQALQASLQARAEASSGEIHPATPSASPR